MRGVVERSRESEESGDSGEIEERKHHYCLMEAISQPAALIKAPQLIGIILGCSVFLITILVVFYLLYSSGSLGKLWEELRADIKKSQGQAGQAGTEGTAGTGSSSKRAPYAAPQLSEQPELYDHLLQARKTLNISPNPPVLPEVSTEGPIIVRQYDRAKDAATLIDACNGSAQYHESEYDPTRIWGWLDMQRSNPKDFDLSILKDTQIGEYISNQFDLLYNKELQDGKHLTIIDKEMKNPIGMLSLVDNCPRNLSIKISNIWITPAYQGLRRGQYALLTLVDWLFNNGYRRIYAEFDERHLIAKKFFQRCGFLCEAVLRKHKIVRHRSQNTAVYALLNSDWEQIKPILQRHLGLSTQVKLQKAITIGESKGIGAKGSSSTTRDDSSKHSSSSSETNPNPNPAHNGKKTKAKVSSKKK